VSPRLRERHNSARESAPLAIIGRWTVRPDSGKAPDRSTNEFVALAPHPSRVQPDHRTICGGPRSCALSSRHDPRWVRKTACHRALPRCERRNVARQILIPGAISNNRRHLRTRCRSSTGAPPASAVPSPWPCGLEKAERTPRFACRRRAGIIRSSRPPCPPTRHLWQSCDLLALPVQPPTLHTGPHVQSPHRTLALSFLR